MSKIWHLSSQIRHQPPSEAGQFGVGSGQENVSHQLLYLELRQASESFQNHLRQLHGGVHEFRGDVELRSELDPLLGQETSSLTLYETLLENLVVNRGVLKIYICRQVAGQLDLMIVQALTRNGAIPLSHTKAVQEVL